MCDNAARNSAKIGGDGVRLHRADVIAGQPIKRVRHGTSQGWRKRLQTAIKRDGRSLHQISLAAGMSESYLWQLFNKNREPTISPLQALARELGTSMMYLMEGYDLTPEGKRFLKRCEGFSTEQRQTLLQFLEFSNIPRTGLTAEVLVVRGVRQDHPVLSLHQGLR